MKVCFVTSYPPNRARLSEYAYSLVNELANRKRIREIYVMADKADKPNDEAWTKPKVKVLRIWEADNPLMILGIIPPILKLRPDIVHFNMHFQSFGRMRITNFLGFLLVPMCRLLGLRVIATLHNLGDLVELKKVHVKPTLLNRLGICVATKILLSSATRVVVTVKFYLTYMEKRYKHRSAVYIPHGTSNHSYMSIDPHEKIVLMFGHMAPHKGLPLMLKMFNELMGERNDVKLVVAGSSHPNFPGYLEKIMEASNSKVEFLGYIPEEDLLKVFGAADVVVLPYLTATGTSGVFHLACGYGKPIVASNLPEIREILAGGASALLFTPGDVEDLKKALLRVLDDPCLSDEMGERNLRFARGETWEMVAGAYENVYAQLLSLRIPSREEAVQGVAAN